MLYCFFSVRTLFIQLLFFSSFVFSPSSKCANKEQENKFKLALFDWSCPPRGQSATNVSFLCCTSTLLFSRQCVTFKKIMKQTSRMNDTLLSVWLIKIWAKPWHLQANCEMDRWQHTFSVTLSHLEKVILLDL